MNNENDNTLASLFENDPLGFLVIEKLHWKAWHFSLLCLFLAFGVTFFLSWLDGTVSFDPALKDRIVFLKDPLVYWYKVILIPLAAYLMISIYSENTGDTTKLRECFKNQEIDIKLPRLCKKLTARIIGKIDLITIISILLVLVILFPTIRRIWSPVDVSNIWHRYWWAWGKNFKLSALWNNLFLYPLMFYFAFQVCFRIFLFSWTVIHSFRPLDKLMMHFHFSDGFGGFKPIGKTLLTHYFFLFLTGVSIPINLIIFRSVYKESLITNPTVLLLIILYLIIAVFSFILPIYYIHRPMAEAKKNELSKMKTIAKNLREGLNRDKIALEKNLTNEELKTLHQKFETYQSFENVYREVKKTKTWPVDWKGIFHSILMTIIPSLLNLFSLSEKVSKLF